MVDGVRIHRRRYDDPDAAVLIEELQDYYVAVYGGRDDTPVHPDEFAPPQGDFAVAFLDGVPVGCGGIRLRADGRAEVKRVFVLDTARGRGIARALLHHLEQTAAALGASWFILETHEQQPEALRLYAAAGYTPVDRFGHYADDPGSVYLGIRLPRA